jgi:hypothetical protein
MHSGLRAGAARTLKVMAWGERLVTWAVLPVGLGLILIALPHRAVGAAAQMAGVTLPFLPGVVFRPVWAAAVGAPIAWDWLIWEVLMAAVLPAGALSALKAGRIMATARWSAPRSPAVAAPGRSEESFTAGGSTDPRD